MLDVKRALAAARAPERTHTLPLSTPWGDALAAAGDDAEVLPEHPRPALERASYTMLNGWWDYVIVPTGRVDASPLDLAGALALVSTATPPVTVAGRIRVPFSPEAPLSGVRRTLTPGELLWYRRRVGAPARGAHDRVILHVDAVDWVAAVRVNGQLAATHVGGYLPFELDVTPYLNDGTGADADGAFLIEACVYDPSDAGTQPRGKQRLHPGGIWYTAQSGIWQSVWLEVVPAAHLTALSCRGAADGTLAVEALARVAEPLGADAALALDLAVFDAEGTRVLDARLPFDAHPATAPAPSLAQLAAAMGAPALGAAPARRLRATLALDAPRLWSPAEPYLYRVEAALIASAAPCTADGGASARAAAEPDRVRSYAAFRTVRVERDGAGTPRFFLNGKPLLLKGVLDQGYWPDGLMTAPADAALVHDIEAARASGFNLLRKHLKVERTRWYYHCDRMGMLVCQDAVQGGSAYNLWHTSRKPTVFSATWGRYRDDIPHHRVALSSDDARYQLEWTATCADMVRYLAGHPSIVAWSLFNEGMGQFDACAAAELVHTIDPTRPLDAASGWYDQHCGDVYSHHNYFRPLTAPRDRGRLKGYARERGFRAFLLSEFGGWAQPVEGHRFSDAVYGYGDFASPAAWRAAVRASLAEAEALAPHGLAGYVYTQLSDVEDEANGILTYDRRVNKLAAPDDAGGADA